jgi:hypothetical protein
MVPVYLFIFFIYVIFTEVAVIPAVLASLDWKNIISSFT